MGLFSSKKTTKRVTAIERMMPDDKIIMSNRAAVTNYLFQSGLNVSTGGKSLPDYIIEASQNSLAVKFNKAYRYAKSGKYAYGLPKASITSEDATDESVNTKLKAYLEATLLVPVDIKYAKVEEPNYYHFMWKQLQDTFDYNPVTNRIGRLENFNGGNIYYLDKAVLNYTQATMDVITDPTYLDQWGYPSEFGETYTRSRDETREQTPYVENVVNEHDFANITFQVKEHPADTTPPPKARVRSFNGTLMDGVAEIGATVNLYNSTTDTLIGSAVSDAQGNFTITLAVPEMTQVTVKVVDSATNTSDPAYFIAPFTNTEDVGTGEQPTPTEVITTGGFSFSFLDWIANNDESVETPLMEKTYIMACYSYSKDGQDYIKYFTYEYGSQAIPELENVAAFVGTTGEFFPRVYARLNKKKLNEAEYKNTPEYKSSKRIAQMLGLDWSQFVDQIHEAAEDNINSTHQIFTTVCAPVNTEDPVIQEYLYRYFSKMYNDLGGTPDPETTAKPGVVLNIKDNVYEHVISFAGIEFKEVTGVIGDVGKYSSRYVPMQLIPSSGSHWGNIASIKYPKHEFMFQVTATTYMSVMVHNLRSMHMFANGKTTANEDDENLVIPLDLTALPHMLPAEKEVLFNKCFYVFINVAKVIKQKWYQSGIFKIVMLVVAIVISVATVGAGAPMAAYAYAALYAIAVSVAVSLAINILAKVLVKLGVNSGVIAAIAIVIAVVALAYGNSDGLQLLLDTSSKTLLVITNAAFQLTSAMTSLELQAVVKQADEFANYAKSQWEIMDEAKKLLEVGVPLDFDVLMGDLRSKVLVNLGESPEAFLARSIGTGNVGTLCFDMVSEYVDSKLTLPDLNTTMQMVKQRGN